MHHARAPGWYAVDPWESAKDRQVGMVSANAPGMGGGRLKLLRPSGAFSSMFVGLSVFRFGGESQPTHLPLPLRKKSPSGCFANASGWAVDEINELAAS